MTDWDTIFAPVMALGREPREGQRLLGNAIIGSIQGKHSLVAEASTGTGKSFAALVPVIDAVLKAKAVNKSFRAAVSTETITLQNQLIEKDLPFLAKLYPGFEYRKLMGRSNYLCLNAAKLNTRGNMQVNSVYTKLETRIASLGDGEIKDVERVLGREVDADLWGALSGSSNFCSDNRCEADRCFSTRARAKALTADIVVCNHALLATDTEMKTGDAFGDGLLGMLDALIVDEGHALEPVLVSNWTKELSEYDLENQSASVSEGLEKGRNLVTDYHIREETERALDGLREVLVNIKKFYIQIAQREDQDWQGHSMAMSLKIVSPSAGSAILSLMTEYEEQNPGRLEAAAAQLEKAIEYLKKVAEEAAEQGVKGRREINKGLRASKDLLGTVEIMQQALASKDGIVQSYGAYGALVDGWVRKSGEPGMTIRLVPLDVSAKAKNIWTGVNTNILLSATLTDLTDLSFRYARDSVGFPDGPEIRVESPFNMQECQLVYISNDDRGVTEDFQYNFDELVELLKISKGRALVLFTSRKELDWAATQLRYMQSIGQFDYPIFVQEKDSNKEKLREAFREDVHSVLLATKSFFVGVDISGESLSLLVLAKYPNAMYNAECKQRITYWRTRGYHKWYERESLTTFQQAAGRLIRSSTDRGVVALLDQRAAKVGTTVAKSAILGINAMRSPYTFQKDVVQRFLG